MKSVAAERLGHHRHILRGRFLVLLRVFRFDLGRRFFLAFRVLALIFGVLVLCVLVLCVLVLCVLVLCVLAFLIFVLVLADLIVFFLVPGIGDVHHPEPTAEDETGQDNEQDDVSLHGWFSHQKRQLMGNSPSRRESLRNRRRRASGIG